MRDFMFRERSFERAIGCKYVFIKTVNTNGHTSISIKSNDFNMTLTSENGGDPVSRAIEIADCLREIAKVDCEV